MGVIQRVLARILKHFWRFAAAVRILPAARVAVRVLASNAPIATQIQALEHWATRNPHRPMSRERAAQSAVDSVRILGRRDKACLPISFTLFTLLTAMQERPSIVTGVKRSEGELVGHAWVEIDGNPVAYSDVQANGAGFRLLYRYPS